MLGRVVITGVPRGLDGGSGFQTVLRTQELQPLVAERLVARAAYPHPFPFGDPRNPHVIFHRIERVGNRLIHVLGSIRDAGSSYSGRSNYLAELIALDSAETHGLHAGPAFAAGAFPWIDRWGGTPRTVPLSEESLIPARDPATPEPPRTRVRCPAWERETGDGGWAGELARSFLDGRRALIWAGSTVNVLELFTEALRLLPVNVRWQVTFNTCEIEPFPSHWRAVRPELGLVGNYDPTNELRLVLGKIRENRSRAPDHELTMIARGERSTHRPPPFSAGDQSEERIAPTDDAALRARLGEIRETRRQRTSQAATGDRSTQSGSVLRWILPAVFLGVFPLMAIALVSNAFSSKRIMVESLDLALSADQGEQTQRARSSSKEKNQEFTRSPIRPSPSADDVKPQAEPTKPDPAEISRRSSWEVDKKRDEVAAVKEASREAQTAAIKALEANPNVMVSLEPESQLKEWEPIPAIPICNDFDVANLLPGLLLDLASPYQAADRLWISPVQGGLDSEQIWMIRGSIYDPNQGCRIDSDVAHLVARDGSLLLKCLQGPIHELVVRLKNSVLAISTGDAGDPGAATVRTTIRFARPIMLNQPWPLDPLAVNPVSAVANDDSLNSLRARVKGLTALTWVVELRHASLSGPVILNHTESHKILSLFRSPAEASGLQYSSFDRNGATEQHRVPLGFDVFVSFGSDQKAQVGMGTSALFKCIPSLTGLESSVLKEVVTNATLRELRDAPQSVANVRNSVLAALREQMDLKLDRLQAELAQLKMNMAAIPPPGSDPVQAPSNPHYRASYEIRTKELSGEIKKKGSELRDHEKHRGSVFSKDADQVIEELKAFATILTPIQVTIKEMSATATTAPGKKSSGKKYSIPLVECPLEQQAQSPSPQVR